MYKARKFVRRHRLATALIAFATLGFAFALVERGRRLEAEMTSGLALATFSRERGDWGEAIRQYKRALVAGIMEDVPIRLLILECLDASGEHAAALAELDSLTHREDLGPHRGRVLLWKARLSFSIDPDFDSDTIQDAINAGLDASDEAFAKALLAPDAAEAIPLLEDAVARDRFDVHARATHFLALFLTAKHDEAKQEAHTLQSLAPGSGSSKLAKAMLDAYESDIDASSRDDRDDFQSTMAILALKVRQLQNLAQPIFDSVSIDQQSALTVVDRMRIGLTATSIVQDQMFERMPPFIGRQFEKYLDRLRLAETDTHDVCPREEGVETVLAAIHLLKQGHFRDSIDCARDALTLPAFANIERTARQLLITAALFDAQERHAPIDFWKYEHADEFRQDLGHYAKYEESANVTYNLGATAQGLRDYDLASLFYERALRLAPHHENAMAGFVWIPIHAGNYCIAAMRLVEKFDFSNQNAPFRDRMSEAIQLIRENCTGVNEGNSLIPIDDYLIKNGLGMFVEQR